MSQGKKSSRPLLAKEKDVLFPMPCACGQGWPWSCIIKDENWPISYERSPMRVPMEGKA